MKVSQQVLEWQAVAEQRGRAEGRAEGRTEGRAEGRAEGGAESLLRLLGRRFSAPVPPDLATTIRASKDTTQLDQWFDAAITAASLEDFRRLARL